MTWRRTSSDGRQYQAATGRESPLAWFVIGIITVAFAMVALLDLNIG